MFNTSSILLGLLFSSIGVGYFMYGKKQHQKIFYFSGIALIAYTFFVTGTLPLLLIGIILTIVPFFIKM